MICEGAVELVLAHCHGFEAVGRQGGVRWCCSLVEVDMYQMCTMRLTNFETILWIDKS